MSHIAFTLGDTKQAALYFDAVIPLMLILDVIAEHGADRFSQFQHPDDVPWDEYRDVQRRFDRLLPPALRAGPKREEWIEVEISALDQLYTLANRYRDEPGRAVDRWLTSKKWDKRLTKFVAGLRLDNASTSLSEALLLPSSDPSSDVFLTLSLIKVIDVDSTSIEQVVAFREDIRSREKLRRLRMFALENYEGKSAAHIQDDILTRLDDYNSEIKRWGFETKHACISLALKSKYMAGGTGFSLVTAILDQPIASAASLAVGVLAEFGNITLEITKMRHEARSVLRKNPISFIADAKEALESRNGDLG